MTIKIEEIYNSSKYGILYIKIIQKANSEDRIKLKKDNPSYIYYENHHILPKSIYKDFGKLKDNPWNSVLLTAREHFICHGLLVKHYKKINNKTSYIKMSKAFHNLSNNNKYSSKIYNLFKLNLSHSKITKVKMSNAWTPERKEKLVLQNKQERHYSKLAKYNMSLGQIGRKHSEESKLKQSESLKIYNKNRPKEHNDNISKALLGRKLTKEQIQKSVKTRKDRYLVKDSNGLSTKDKKSLSFTGNKNPNALKINIYSNENELKYFSHGEFKKLCLDNNLPQRLLVKSYKNNTFIEITNRNSKKGKYNKYQGWYARVIE